MRHIETALFFLIIASAIVPPEAGADVSTDDKINEAERLTLDLSIASITLRTVNAETSEPVQTTRFSLFQSQAPPPAPMTGKERLHYFMNCTFGIEPMLRSAVSAGIKQARDSVPEWGQGMEGYGIRFGSSYGRRVIRNSIHHGIASLLKEDPRYYPSGRSGIWTRSLYAAGQTFITHKDTGEARFAYSSILGTVSSIYISRAWYPERKQRLTEYLTSTAFSLGFVAAKNIVREFWPDIKRTFRH